MLLDTRVEHLRRLPGDNFRFFPVPAKVRDTENSRTDNVSAHFTRLLKNVGLHREGLGFYSLRHTFRTIADGARDPVAIDLIMGHTDPSMGGHYRERIEDSRLVAVTDYVRQWLFGEAPDGGSTGPDSTVPDSCDPSDPCAPTGENVVKSGVGRGSQGVAISGRATPENLTRTWVGSEGAQASQISPSPEVLPPKAGL